MFIRGWEFSFQVSICLGVHEKYIKTYSMLLLLLVFPVRLFATTTNTPMKESWLTVALTPPLHNVEETQRVSQRVLE